MNYGTQLEIPLIKDSLRLELTKFRDNYFVKYLDDQKRLHSFLTEFFNESMPFNSQEDYEKFLKNRSHTMNINLQRHEIKNEDTNKKIFSPSMNDINNASKKSLGNDGTISPRKSGISIKRCSKSKKNSNLNSPRPEFAYNHEFNESPNSDLPRHNSGSLRHYSQKNTNFNDNENINMRPQTLNYPPQYYKNQLGDELDIDGGTNQIETIKLYQIPLVALYFSNIENKNAISYNEKLINIYNEINSDKKNFELIFVNIDLRKMKKNVHKQQHYQFIKDMPWPCVPYNPKFSLHLLEKFEHKSFPSLIPMKKDGSPIPQINAKYELDDKGIMAIYKWINLIND